MPRSRCTFVVSADCTYVQYTCSGVYVQKVLTNVDLHPASLHAQALSAPVLDLRILLNTSPTAWGSGRAALPHQLLKWSAPPSGSVNRRSVWLRGSSLSRSRS